MVNMWGHNPHVPEDKTIPHLSHGTKDNTGLDGDYLAALPYLRDIQYDPGVVLVNPDV